MSYPIEDIINRRTGFRFAGENLKLDLSLGLFSSAGVDAGSLLLLKSVARQCSLDSFGKDSRILDVGCGTGTLGLALARRCPEASVEMVDRDEMAVRFSRHNARLNRIENIRVHSTLMLSAPEGLEAPQGPYSLILSNFPAKAGDPVLKDYLKTSMNLLEKDGRSALVIIHTLADRCRELIEEVGGEILHRDASKQHTVFHFRPAAADTSRTARKPAEAAIETVETEASAGPVAAGLPTCYIRHQDHFKLKRSRYSLDTVWNISDFDTLSWRLKLLGNILDTQPFKGHMAFWAPGQGHLPSAVCLRPGAKPLSVTLLDRDLLSLITSRHNLNAAGIESEIQPLPDPALFEEALDAGSLDLLVTDLSPVPGAEWTQPLKKAAAAVVKPIGIWAAVGHSSDMAALTKGTRGWTPLTDKRNKGWRAVLFTRNM